MARKQIDKVDIVDVARRARVSISTVSRSFNHPDLVNPATRKKIERAVQAWGTSEIGRRKRCMGNDPGPWGWSSQRLITRFLQNWCSRFRKPWKPAGFHDFDDVARVRSGT